MRLGYTGTDSRMRFDTYIFVNIKITALWDVTSCSLVDKRQYLRRNCPFIFNVQDVTPLNVS
jgi:hypothetical protein